MAAEQFITTNSTLFQKSEGEAISTNPQIDNVAAAVGEILRENRSIYDLSTDECLILFGTPKPPTCLERYLRQPPDSRSYQNIFLSIP